MNKGKILIIDDNYELLDYLKDFFMIYHYETLQSETGMQGIANFKRFSPDIVLTDIRLPDINGDEVVKKIKEINSSVPIIIMTAYSDQNIITEAMKNGAVDLIKKPFKSKDLKALITKIETFYKKNKIAHNKNIIQWQKIHYRLSNDINLVPNITNDIFNKIDYMDDNSSFLILGLQEIIINAIEHGNLEINYQEKQRLLNSKNLYDNLLRERAKDKRFCNRYIDIKVFSTPDYLEIEIKDQGKGFDLSSIPNPKIVDNFFKESGKGILLAMKIFDKIKYNKKGNGVILYKFNSKEEENLNKKMNIQNKSSDFFGDYRSFIDSNSDIELELDIASDFQRTLLPKIEDIKKFKGVDTKFVFLPLMKVSGDFIDITKLKDDVYGYFISDISGHGISAALISSMLKVFFSLYAKEILSPQYLFEMLNREFNNYLNSGEFFTSFYGIYFVKEKKFIYTNANHPPPLLFKQKNKEIIELDSEGFFIGVFMESEFKEEEITLDSQDKILLYTDGLIEYKNPKGESWGVQRLKESFFKYGKEDINTLIDGIKSDVNNFCQHEKPQDDLTLIILTIE